MLSRMPAGAKAGLVLLHGRGGSARDILSLLDHAALPQVAAIAPEAPGNSWWPTSFLAPTAQMAPFVGAGVQSVAKAVASLRDSGLTSGQIWLAGFSQGACLALECFARQQDWGQVGLAGVFGFSGGLVGTADHGTASPELMGHRDKTFAYPALTGKVWISVHERDPHIPLKRARDSAEALQTAGATVQMQVYPGAGHSVMHEDIAALRSALNL
jgi:phospholipase/carboxylesterase